jgi:glucose-6-phosphate isomerase
VDPVDVTRATAGLDPETTLVLVVSKTFTTAETMLNARTLKDWMTARIPAAQEDVLRQHFVAVSTAVDKATQVHM